MVDLTPKCKKCGVSLTLETTRALPDGGFVCKNCYESTTSSFSPRLDGGRLVSSSSSPSTSSIPGISVTSDDSIETKNGFFSKKRYECFDCGYKFKRDPEMVVHTCPYCGKSNIRQQVEEPADELLRDD